MRIDGDNELNLNEMEIVRGGCNCDTAAAQTQPQTEEQQAAAAPKKKKSSPLAGIVQSVVPTLLKGVMGGMGSGGGTGTAA